MTDSVLVQMNSEADPIQPSSLLGGLQHRRLKVLIGAYACSPAKGSEYGVGWGWVVAISEYHDLWVLTAEQNRNEIEAELNNRPDLRNRIRFYYIPRTRYKWAEKVWPPAYLFTYRHQWLRDMFEVGRKLHKDVGFDLVHQITYVGFRVPGVLWKLDVPFVWGPIGGLEQTSWRLLPSLGLRGCLYFTARNILNEMDRRFSRAPKRAFAAGKGGIISATSGIQKEIKRFYQCDSVVTSEIGLPPIRRSVPHKKAPYEPLHLLWCGNLFPGKALPYLLEALQQLPDAINWKLSILGSGPLQSRWRNIAKGKQVDHRCEWLGQVPRSQVLQTMQSAHALIITSVYDLTSTVLVEALANGLPVICPDHCGFTDAITPDCGIKVSPASRKTIVSGIRNGILALVSEKYRFQLAEGAIRRSQHFHWEHKAQLVNDLYSSRVASVNR